jgi:hypothetical protein
MAKLIVEGEVTGLPPGEILLRRFREGYVGHDAIALPFPVTR